MTEKTGNTPNHSEPLVKTGGVTGVTGVTTVLDESLTRARARACVRAHGGGLVSGNTGNTGNSVANPPSSKRETGVTGASDATGNTGNSPLADRPSLSAALLLPVRHIAWLPARLTYRFQRQDGTQVVWTSHPGVYGALTGPQGAAPNKTAAFSPKEFEAACAAGESGVATECEFTAWVATKLAAPGWRLGAEEALRWTPRGRVAGFGWWPGSEQCEPHDIERERGWTVGYAAAVFGLELTSVDVHAADPAPAAPTPQPRHP